MTCAYCARLPPCSTALSSGPSACAHWLSLRPSQKRNGLYAVPAIGMVRRSVVPTPLASGMPSWNSRLGSWHVAQETLPFALSRVSKKSRCPSSAAAGSSAHRLLGSGGSAPTPSIESDSASWNAWCSEPGSPAGPAWAAAETRTAPASQIALCRIMAPPVTG